MADSKVSELPAATSVGSSDYLYIVQSGSSKKVAVSDVFANSGNVVFKGNIAIESSIQLLAAPGAIDLTKTITHLSADATGGTCTISSGKTNQIKIITMIASSGGTLALRSNIANSANVEFTTTGDTATLLYTNNKWFVIGGTASIT